MEADEPLGLNATISSVLYANTNHPEWKKQYPGTDSSFFFFSYSLFIYVVNIYQKNKLQLLFGFFKYL